MDKMREEFEKDYGLEYLKKDAEGNYLYWHSKLAWEYFQKGWLASRAALVVELPSHVNDMDSAPMLYESIVEQLNELGIRYDKY